MTRNVMHDNNGNIMVDECGDPIECLGCIGSETECRGKVEWHWPGHGIRNFPRCEQHQMERIVAAEEERRRYPMLPPSDFDPGFAGERWDDNY